MWLTFVRSLSSTRITSSSVSFTSCTQEGLAQWLLDMATGTGVLQRNDLCLTLTSCRIVQARNVESPVCFCMAQRVEPSDEVCQPNADRC